MYYAIRWYISDQERLKIYSTSIHKYNEWNASCLQTFLGNNVVPYQTHIRGISQGRLQSRPRRKNIGQTIFPNPRYMYRYTMRCWRKHALVVHRMYNTKKGAARISIHVYKYTDSGRLTLNSLYFPLGAFRPRTILKTTARESEVYTPSD